MGGKHMTATIIYADDTTAIALNFDFPDIESAFMFANMVMKTKRETVSVMLSNDDEEEESE
jgi:hypothetical protein